MIKNWKLRVVVFLIVLGIFTWIYPTEDFNENIWAEIAGKIIPISLAALFLGATEAEAFPDCLAQSFTKIMRKEDRIIIKSTWVYVPVIIAPLFPILIFCVLLAFFSHQMFPRYIPDFKIYCASIASGLLLIFFVSLMPSGFCCTIKENYVRWVFTYFGKDAKISECPNVRFIEYSLTNGSTGGPVVTIEYDGSDGGRKTKKLKFRNLYKCSREEFCEILAEYLGPPERITSIPTKKGHQPLLVEKS